MVKPSKKIIMHNCCFLTILNELTFLLYPLDTRCVLNLVLNNVFFLWSMNVVYLGTLLVHLLSYISLKMKGTAMCWWCSSVAFPFITPRDTILFVNRKEAWRKRVLLRNYVRGEKKNQNNIWLYRLPLNSVTDLWLAFHSLSFVSGQKLSA